MGREHDLINAAKNGNVAQIEKLLGQRGKKSGLHNIMNRSVNPNYQDEMGYSPLHYASMNGHRGAVELLLKYDASTNIPDHSGNYPLHLAAFNGHAEVSRILINTGPSRANVNEQNGTEDTALHSAAQYGYNQVVAVLLENHADPYIRNCRKESALDLAAQYGRIETVKLLLSYHPNLLQSLVKTHSPLHLAARNGHISVVSNLLGCGMSVNTQCDTGTALHEAALFGKLDVCNLLLQCDVDIKVKDKNQQTVMDLLMSHPSAKTKEISSLIYHHSQRRSIHSSTSSLSSIESSEMKSTNMPTRASTMVYRRSNYDDVPGPRPASGIKRCDTYDSVPAHRSMVNPSQRGYSQASYDFVPLHHSIPETHQNSDVRPPDQPDIQPSVSDGYAMVTDMTTVIPHDGSSDYLKSTQSSYDYVPCPQQAPDRSADPSTTKPDTKPLLKPSTVDGYAFVMAADPHAVMSDPALTAQNVKDGYTMLGVPIQPCAVASSSKQHPPHPTTSQQDFGMEEYSTVRHETDRKSSESAMQDKENLAYLQKGVKQARTSLAKSPPCSGADVSSQHPPVYEIPPLQRESYEGEYGLVGAVTPHPAKPPPYKPTTTADVGGGTYDMVTFPARDHDSIPFSSPTYEIPPPFRSKEEETPNGTYGFVQRPQERAPSKACPLDIPQYEIVNLRSPGGELGPETQPTASIPGYELMGPGPSPSQYRQFGEYEVLALPQNREYMNVKPEEQQAPPEQSAPIPVPRAGSVAPHRGNSAPPIYEIAPLPRSAEPTSPPNVSSQSAPVYEIAPAPRPRPPPREPTEAAARPVPAPRHGSMIKDEPEIPPRKKQPMNEYQEFKPPAAAKSGLPAPYEQVRVEGPQGKVNWEQLRQPPLGSSAGEYCTLDPTSIGIAFGISQPPPIPPRDDVINTPGIPPRDITSQGSSVPDTPPNPPRDNSSQGSSDVPDTPGIPPPSPTTAEVAVFEAFTSDETAAKAYKEPFTVGMIETIPEESVGEATAAGVVHRDRPVNHPVPLPRRESLNDKKINFSDHELMEMVKATSPLPSNERQDPFYFPPSKLTGESSALKEKEPATHLAEKKNDFASLHKRWSPCNSRENLMEEQEEPRRKKAASSALLYENVLFKRSDSMLGGSRPSPKERAEVTKQDDKSEPEEGEYRLSALDASSPLDESAEWDKIEAFLSSIGDIEIPKTLDDQIADAGKATTVAGWLQALGLDQYESDLMSNGFDNINFFNGGILEDQDLLEIGVQDLSHRKIILEAVKSLTVPVRLSDSSSKSYSSAREWLSSLCLGEYAGRFEHQGYSSMDRVRMIWEVELTSVLDISSLGHRKRMLASLATPRRLTLARKKYESELLNSTGNFGLDEALAELSMVCPDEKPAEHASKQPTAGQVVEDSGTMATTMAEELLNSEVLKKKTEERKKENRWRHDPEVLIKGSVNYTTQYLGSHMVKEISGVSSTIDACRKMRLSTAKLQKVPSVVLSISVNGIKFIDARSKLLVSYHDMRNVSYITQDPEDKRVFAYIAKDAKIDKHYCHVFRVEQKNLSDEVTMSIGQAFELAYEQFVQIQKHLSTQAQQVIR